MSVCAVYLYCLRCLLAFICLYIYIYYYYTCALYICYWGKCGQTYPRYILHKGGAGVEANTGAWYQCGLQPPDLPILFVVQVLIRSLLVWLLLWNWIRTSNYGHCYNACLNSLSFVLTFSLNIFQVIIKTCRLIGAPRHHYPLLVNWDLFDISALIYNLVL